MNCYFDGSIGGEQNRWMTIAGIVATDRAWAVLEKAWVRMLAERDPPATCIHMTDLVTLNGDFGAATGWDQVKTKALASDAIQVFTKVSKSALHAYSGSIDAPACERLRKEGLRIDKPSVICAEISLGSLINWYWDKHQFEMAYLFYDQNEPYIKSIRSRWERLVNHRNRLVTTELFWGSIKNITPVVSEYTPGVQMADLIAWATTRRLRNKPGDYWQDLADTLIGNRSKDGIIGATQCDPLDEASLRKHAHDTKGLIKTHVNPRPFGVNIDS